MKMESESEVAQSCPTLSEMNDSTDPQDKKTEWDDFYFTVLRLPVKWYRYYLKVDLN